MKRVGAYEAKTRLPRLLEEVRGGARICITRRGVPVAMLVPGFREGSRDPHETIRSLRNFRKGLTLRAASDPDQTGKKRRS